MENPNVASLRQEYSKLGLYEAEMSADPIEQFGKWFQDAIQSGIIEPNIMTVATASRDGHPSARTMLLKAFDSRGFTFYTNYESRKGQDLKENPKVALVFWWDRTERQVIVEGTVRRVTAEEADTYFQSRPRGSRIGAWVSRQSRIIESREVLDQLLLDTETRFEEKEIPRPDYWGGFLVEPQSMEFWQGRPNRLHDRIRYHRMDDGTWKIERLSP